MILSVDQFIKLNTRRRRRPFGDDDYDGTDPGHPTPRIRKTSPEIDSEYQDILRDLGTTPANTDAE